MTRDEALEMGSELRTALETIDWCRDAINDYAADRALSGASPAVMAALGEIDALLRDLAEGRRTGARLAKEPTS